MGMFDSGRNLLTETGWDESIDYRRDGLSVGNVVCKVGQSIMYTQDIGGIVQSGTTMQVHRIDFFIKACDLSVARPEVRDIIEWNGKQYAVCDNDVEQCWRWHDRAQTIYRIHAEEVYCEQTD